MGRIIIEPNNSNIIVKMIENRLSILSKKIEQRLDSDLIFFSADIDRISEAIMNETVESTFLKSKRKKKNRKLTIILTTFGGEGYSVISMVQFIRRFYSCVYFIVPELAISAGTLFCLSGNEIFMNESSALGALDLQIVIENEKVQSLNIVKKKMKQLELAVISNPNDTVSKHILSTMKLDYIYREKEQLQEDIRTIAETWLKKYKFAPFEQYDEERKNKILNIPNNLIDMELLQNIEIFFHENRIFIEKANSIGLEVKNYEKVFPDISITINEFQKLNMDYTGYKRLAYGLDKTFCIYSRLVKDIPMVAIQENPNINEKRENKLNAKHDMTTKVAERTFGIPLNINPLILQYYFKH